ncbi:MAG: alpha/beta fold hydrolase [Saprospiraceae bacterium]
MNKIKRSFTLLGLRLYLNTLALFNPGKAGALAFKIFCTPRSGRLREKDRAFLNTADEQKDLYVNDLNIRSYHWRGAGDTVLLVHGWESNAARWQRLVRQLLAKGFDVVAVDGPAHGASGGEQFNVPLYASLLEAVVERYRPQSLVGHSIGGFACLYLLSEHHAPSVHSLALLGAPAELTHIMAGYQRLLGLSRRVMRGMESLFRRRFGRGFDEFSGPAMASQLEVQGLIVHDLHDATVPYADAMLYAEHWPQARLVTTRSQGHRLNGDGVPEVVVGFLEVVTTEVM